MRLNFGLFRAGDFLLRLGGGLLFFCQKLLGMEGDSGEMPASSASLKISWASVSDYGVELKDGPRRCGVNIFKRIFNLQQRGN